MELGTIGVLADTHSNKADGSDLPDRVLTAFKGVDLIVHLGDIGRKGILDRLATVAPVWVPVGGNKGYMPAGTSEADAARLAARTVRGRGGTVAGLTFNLAQPDKKITVGDDDLTFDSGSDCAALLQRRFKEPVNVVAFGGTHRPMVLTRHDVLFVNPGSPTIPMPRTPPAVAVIKLGKAPTAKVIELKQ